MTTTLHLSRLHWPVTVLGPGRRVGVWFQGCSIGCKGCCSKDTWHATPEHSVTIADVLRWVGERSAAAAGFTISGGEPFDQPEALMALLVALRALPAGKVQPDTLIYSGYPWRTLLDRHAPIVALADAIISEPFVDGRPADALRGSSNQRLHVLTPLGQVRYSSWAPSEQRQLQTHFDGKSIWMIGIPRPGDLDRLRDRLGASGVELGQCSWLA